MRLKNLLLVAVVATFAACSTATKFTSFVDPKIGTGDHGHVFVGANVPFGICQPNMQTRFCTLIQLFLLQQLYQSQLT